MNTFIAPQTGMMETNLLTSLVESKSLFPALLVECKDCKHLAQDEERHRQHVHEARHVHSLRHLAYR